MQIFHKMLTIKLVHGGGQFSRAVSNSFSSRANSAVNKSHQVCVSTAGSTAIRKPLSPKLHLWAENTQKRQTHRGKLWSQDASPTMSHVVLSCPVTSPPTILPSFKRTMWSSNYFKTPGAINSSTSTFTQFDHHCTFHQVFSSEPLNAYSGPFTHIFSAVF